MKIENPLSAQVSTEAAKQTGGVTQAQTGAGGRNRIDGNSDRVQLSSLSAALRDISEDDSGRTGEVQRVAAAVESGSYKIDPQTLGRQIIRDSLEIS